MVPASGGTAMRLTRHRHDDLHSSWSPDGDAIVFTSMRDGYMNLWRIGRDGTRIRQLTHSDRFMRNPHWSRDGTGPDVISFSGLIEADVYRDHRPYRMSPEGGEHERLHDAFGSEPRISPDGRRTVFTRGGYYHGWSRRHYTGPDAMNVWIHDRMEDRFESVTRRDGDDGSARWAGSDTLVFMSDRALDTVNLYRIRLSGQGQARENEPERLTGFEGRDVQSFDVSADGSTAVISVWDRLYTLDLDDPEATVRPVSLRAGDDGRDDHELRRIDRDITEAALSPDGRVMAYIAYGRVYVRNMDEYSPTRAVTPNTHARHVDIAWSPDGLSLYFTSDKDSTSSIYQVRVALTRAEVRRAYDRPAPSEPPESVLYLPEEILAGLSLADLPLDAPDAVRDPSDPRALPEDPGDPLEPFAGLRIEDPEDPFAPVDPADPPAPTDPDPGPEPEPEPERPEREMLQEDEVPAPDQAEGLPESMDPARWHDAVQFSISPLVASDHNDREVSPSPDGSAIAFRRGRGDLVVMDLDTGRKRTLVAGWDSSLHWRWSPDGRFIAYAVNDLDFSTNIFIVPADGSRKPVNITRHPRNDVNPRWSADGRKLSFLSNRSGNTYDLYRVYLDPAMETLTRRERIDYYNQTVADAGKRRPLPVRIPGGSLTPPESKTIPIEDYDLENAWRRVEAVAASPVHQSGNEMTPCGNRYVFNAGTEGLISVKWDGSERRRIGARVNVSHLSITGERVVYIANGRAGVVPVVGGEHRHPDISDRIRIDLREQSLQKFREAARVMEEGFYRPDMKGLDWPAVVADYEELIRRARTASEFSDIVNRLMGELAASHTGVSNPGPGSALREPSGRLGIEYERVDLPGGRPGYRVVDVIPGGPADRGPMRLEVGDVITDIDMEAFRPDDSMLRRLRGTVGREVIVGFTRQAGRGSVSYHALLRPVAYDEFSRLRYDAFREESRRLVSELSGGRIGYIHIQAMNQASLEAFQGHLYAAAEGKDGLIIDVRNNGGGHTTDRILASIMTREHAYTVPVGADPGKTGHYPQDRLDAPRYTLPVNMLANEKSYSNAEILAHAFSTLERGTLVGRQTYGGVISTGRHTLIDGATVRRPFRGWFLPDGSDMEHNGAMPDLEVEQTPDDEVAGRDRQLKAAVKDMLERIGGNGS